ncbi:hypothetical protein BC833DRAFT_591419 [Globomyces pollinis-pini]|nr:hypothetical protein BC833DRAFT_591419 [Globomyces pollinis-pini]
MDSVEIPRIDIFNNFCFSLMVGSLMIDFIKLTVLSVKPIPRASTFILIALVFMIISLVISATRRSQPSYTGFILGIIGQYLQLLAIMLIVYLSYLRTSILHTFQPRIENISKVLIVAFVPMAWTVRIINTINDVNQFKNREATVSFITQQVTRCTLILIASIFVLYFETYTTLQIFKTIGNTLQHASHLSNQKRIEIYAKLLSFLILIMFLLSFAFQLLMIFDITVGFTPLYSIGWSLVLKRMIEFKTDFNTLMNSLFSDGLPLSSSSPVSDPEKQSQECRVICLPPVDNIF